MAGSGGLELIIVEVSYPVEVKFICKYAPCCFK